VGGDEFVVVLPDRGVTETATVVERVTANLKDAMTESGLEVEIGFSTGWAQLDPARHKDFEQLIGEVDAAMYPTKRGRRERAKR
jgi:diguanylate cyclase (GGDEF)-like protein